MYLLVLKNNFLNNKPHVSSTAKIYLIRVFLLTQGLWANWKIETSESAQYFSNY